jgi:hypothetical protein
MEMAVGMFGAVTSSFCLLYLQACFIHCSPGCQELAARIAADEAPAAAAPSKHQAGAGKAKSAAVKDEKPSHAAAAAPLQNGAARAAKRPVAGATKTAANFTANRAAAGCTIRSPVRRRAAAAAAAATAAAPIAAIAAANGLHNKRLAAAAAAAAPILAQLAAARRSLAPDAAVNGCSVGESSRAQATVTGLTGCTIATSGAPAALAGKASLPTAASTFATYADSPGKRKAASSVVAAVVAASPNRKRRNSGVAITP